MRNQKVQKSSQKSRFGEVSFPVNQVLQVDINPRVQLNMDSGKAFLRIWSLPTRRGEWRDMEIIGNQIPVKATFYLTVAEQEQVITQITPAHAH